jgi:hypothetical protein
MPRSIVRDQRGIAAYEPSPVIAVTLGGWFMPTGTEIA